MPSTLFLFLQADQTSWLYDSPQAMCTRLITSSLSLSVRLSNWVQRSLIKGVVVSMMIGFSLFICISPIALCGIRELNDILGFPIWGGASILLPLSTALCCACHVLFSFFCSSCVSTGLVGFLGLVGLSVFLVCPCALVHVSLLFL